MKYSTQCCMQIYVILAGIFAIFLFISGFFSMKMNSPSVIKGTGIPSFIGDQRINNTSIYSKQVDKLIVMVIDALRFDFVDEINRDVNMPFTDSLIQNQKACILRGHVNAPTVTLPRIKAMTTGAVPSFIDVVYNFGSNKLQQDNIVELAEKHAMNVVFFGDDTWLKLFPDSFLRKDGTTSFFVADFTEVDDNVTRHLDSELAKDDWTIMILHYLGLDHIGHLEGPRSAHIVPKLLEMDSVVKRIYDKIKELKENSHMQSMILICGDHGMKDSGGHGGATSAETTVPIITIGISCPRDATWMQRTVSQVDLVPTLSFFLGLPIPTDNVGKIIPLLLSGISIEKRLFAFYYNAKQIAEQYKLLPSGDSKEAYLKFREAERLHSQWLISKQNDFASSAEKLYVSALQTMSSELVEALVKYDLYLIIVAIFIVFQLCVVLPLKNLLTKRKQTSVIFQIFAFVVFYFYVNKFCCSHFDKESLLCSFTEYSLLTVFSCLIIISVNTAIIVNLCSFTSPFFTSTIQMPTNRRLKFFVTGSTLHVLSLLSSSFIEEEHQVWYFLWLTFLLVVFHSYLKSFLLTGCRAGPSACHWLGSIIVHRVLRKLNQTGDKWAHLTDISDWLLDPDQRLHLTTFFVLGLAGSLLCCFYLNNQTRPLTSPSNLLDDFLCTAAVILIYLYRSSTGAVISISDNFRSRGIAEVKIFWYLLAALMGKNLILCWRDKNSTNRAFHLVAAVTKCWLLLSLLLHRPHNAVLPPVLMWISLRLFDFYRETSQPASDTRWLTLAHTWLGMVFYFYQGNSNSLATIDVASGYTGQQDYNPFIVGALLMVNTYAAPILSYLILSVQLIMEGATRRSYRLSEHMYEVTYILIVNRLTVIVFYLVLITFMRHHLFVWTVFSPKLLYEAVFTAITFLFVILLNLINAAFLKNRNDSQKKLND